MDRESDTFIDKKTGEMGHWIAMHEYEGKVLVGVGDSYDFITKQEAIAAARAILKHFDVDFNTYEENISDRYRAPSEEELAKFLDENPNYKIIPKEAYDPDAPLSSELSKHVGT